MAKHADADAAEAAFYAAFADGDEAAMREVWAPRGDIVCIHPLGPRLVGYDLVMASWRAILSNEAPRHFDVEVLAKWTDAALAIHNVDEVISVPGAGVTFRPVLATNVYARIGGYWYITVHHASIDARGEESAATTGASGTRH